jgi:sialic acid synthase SpsE
MSNRTLVIGEIAACHDGDLQRALDLVVLCADIGCDAAKTQYCSDPAKLVARRHAPEYLDSYRLLNFPLAWHAALAATCEAHGIEYMCTTYLAEDIPVVAPYVKRFKIASFESMDRAFFDAHLPWLNVFAEVPRTDGVRRTVIVSVGLMDSTAADEASAWIWNADAVLLCTSSYPCPIKEVQLGAITHSHCEGPDTWPFGFDGLSDHTRHPLTGALAVAAGASIIEFHLRLDDTDPRNADYAVARTPDEARAYVENIRTAEVMMGDGVKKIQDSERAMLRYRVAP